MRRHSASPRKRHTQRNTRVEEVGKSLHGGHAIGASLITGELAGGVAVSQQDGSAAIAAPVRFVPGRGEAGERSVVARRDSTYRRALALGDLIAGLAALTICGVTAGLDQLHPAMALVACLIVPVNKLLGLYDRDTQVLNKTTLDESPRIINVALIFAIAVWVVHDRAYAGSGGFSSTTLLQVWLVASATMIAGRVASRRIARALVTEERCLVVGSARDANALSTKFSLTNSIKASVVGRVPIDIDELAPGNSGVLGDIGQIARIVREQRIDRVIVVPDERDPEEVCDVIRAIKSIDVHMSVLPRMLEAVGSSLEVDEICGIQLMGVKDFRMTSSSRHIKRSVDCVGAGFGLLLAAPLFAVAAIAIKLDSAGPVFYKQRRIGRDGRSFRIVKFRTMVDGADRQRAALAELNESEGLFKMASDPRITRIGAILRKTSLDELPQLINVLRGDMSLVGPRPLVPDEDENITGWYRRRSQITPGITGVWQLHGPVRVPLGEMVKLDYMYVANWSLWTDIKILLRTIPHVLNRRGI